MKDVTENFNFRFMASVYYRYIVYNTSTIYKGFMSLSFLKFIYFYIAVIVVSYLHSLITFCGLNSSLNFIVPSNFWLPSLHPN